MLIGQVECLHIANPFGGFEADHGGRCPRGADHLKATYHVRISGWCGEVCEPCKKILAERHRAIIRELVMPVQLLSVPAVPAVYGRHVGETI